MNPERLKICLGAEYDEALRDAVLAVFAELGAPLTRTLDGIGGSQEVVVMEAKVDGETIVVEAETYIGLTISGEKQTVERLVEKIRARIGKLP